MRLGILGGTFDPPHTGHLLAALDAIEVLSLDQLVLVPAATQPLKGGLVMATPAERLTMTSLLAAVDPRFTVDSIEIDRGGLSFTVDTLAEMAERWPDADRYFLVGADTLDSFASWREPARVLQLARLAVLARSAADGEALAASGAGVVDRLAAETPGAIPPLRLRTRRVDVSSTEVRARVRSGRTIAGFVPDAVAAFIASAGLYR